MDDMTLATMLLPILGVCAASIIAGILAGLLGVGGGIVLVPVMFWILTAIRFPAELSMHMAVATSIATIAFTSVSSARAHHRRGAVDPALLRRWGPGLVLGALAGGLAARFVSPDGLRAIFGVIALGVAVNMALPRALVLRDSLPASAAAHGAMGATTGFLSALMGIGGGTLSVPILTAFSVATRRAVGTAAAFGFLIALPAAIGFMISGWTVPDRPPLSAGYVSLPAAALILPFTIGFAPLGARIAHAVDPVWIRRAFAVFLALTGLRMLSALAV